MVSMWPDPDHEGICSQAMTTNIMDLVNAYYVLCALGGSAWNPIP